MSADYAIDLLLEEKLERKAIEWEHFVLPKYVVDYWLINEWLRKAIPEIDSPLNKIKICAQFVMRCHSHDEKFTQPIKLALNELPETVRLKFNNTDYIFPTMTLIYWSLSTNILDQYPTPDPENLSKVLYWYLQWGQKEFFVPELLKSYFKKEEHINALLKPFNYTEVDYTYLSQQLLFEPIDSVKTKKILPKDDILILGYPNVTSGVGQLCRSVYLALKKSGARIGLCDVDLTSNPYRDNTDITDYTHITNLSRAAKIHLFIGPGSEIIRKNLSFPDKLRGRQKTIGFIPWELDKWKKELNSCFDPLDEIWSMSEFSAIAFKEQTNKPVLVAPTPIVIPPFEQKTKTKLGLNQNTFYFFSMYDPFSFSKRKNPEAVIHAFKKAFKNKNDSVKLILKVLRESDLTEIKKIASDDQRIEIITQNFNRQEQFSFLSNMDCFVSLHRAEGFGMGIAEAMFLKIPTIATNYSGNLEFCNSSTCYLVDYKLSEIKRGDYVFFDNAKWAEADIEHASHQMLNVYKNSTKRKSITQTAFQFVNTNYDLERSGLTLEKMLSTF